MTAYRFTVTFTADRNLTADEIADLVSTVVAQLEEPVTFTDEGTTEATYSTTSVVIEWPDEVTE